MDLVMAIAPLIIVGGILVYVIKRLEYKNNKGSLGKKKSKGEQNLLDSLIPMGTLFGLVIGVFIDMFMFSSFSLAITASIGAGIGCLVGYFAYESYSKVGN
ncbi:hypothetical protein [Lysinibacillus sp. 3P01SB]|uniref:hypothetical protein n=1 Tax=Lysinibacillus sp. 3P01SB TaxID=3132284 RepID=UPI0039A62479